jgi:hypothetical protein
MRLLSVAQAREQLGNISVSRIYELLGEGALDARKLHGRTLIVAESVDRLIESLPPAIITTKPRGVAAKAKAKVKRERLT